MNRMMMVLALGLSVTCVSCAQTYQVIDLGVHPDFETSEPTGINSLGQVSGFWSRNNDSFRRAFVFDRPGCTMVDVGARVPRASSEAMAINDAAMAVGTFRPPNEKSRAFSFHQGVFRDLGGNDQLDQHALAVNKGGTIVGFQSVPGLSAEDAVSYRNGQAVTFPTFVVIPPSGTASVSRTTGISESGEVTGPLRASGGSILGMKLFPNLNRWFQIRPPSPHPVLPDFDRVMEPRAINFHGNVTGIVGSTVPHAFLSRNHFEPTQDLGTLDSAHPEWFSVAHAINTSARVVGVAQNSTGITAFLYDGSTMIDLNTRLSATSGWKLIGALAINDKGEIAAQASFNNGPSRAVLLLPSGWFGGFGQICPAVLD